jgi:Zn-finger nucleic acid-binding protein
MKCPICHDHILDPALLDENVPALICPGCEGVWLDANEYLGWLRNRGPALVEKPGEEELPVWDTQELKLCPACGRILTRFRVVPGTRFYLDRCSNCNGVWFDRNEWDVLVQRNLHDKVNQFFTRPWQTRIQEEDTRQALDQLYLEKFGVEDYARVRDTWDWLWSHPQKSMILAFLQAEKPYEI